MFVYVSATRELSYDTLGISAAQVCGRQHMIVVVFSRSSRCCVSTVCWSRLPFFGTRTPKEHVPPRWSRSTVSSRSSTFETFYPCQSVHRSLARGNLLAVPAQSSVRYFESSPPVRETEGAIPEVSYEYVKKMSQDDRGVIIDVRDQSEREAYGRIPGALNIPLPDIPEMLSLKLEDLRARYHIDNLESKNDEIVFHCKGGVRSAKACHIAKQLGYKNVKNYKGSMDDWNEREQATSRW